MKKIFSFFGLLLAVLVSAVILSGCGGGKTARVESNTTAQQQSDGNGTEAAVDPESYRYLVKQSNNAPNRIVGYKAEEVSDYYSLLWSLSDEVRGVVISNPKLVLILLDYFGDEYLAIQNKRSLIALKDFVIRAKKAYGLVNSQEFNREMKKYLKLEQEFRDRKISWEVFWSQDQKISAGFKNSADAKAYYRRFSVKYNPCNETWKDILSLFEKKVNKALAEVDETPDILVTFEQPQKGYYVTDKEGWQKVANIKVDTSYSSEAVSVRKIDARIYSWKGTDELEDCRLVDENQKQLSDYFDIDFLTQGVEVSRIQDSHTIKTYSLECWIDDGVVDGQNSVAVYDGNFDYEFTGGSQGWMGIYKSIYLRGITGDDEFVLLKAKAFKKQLEEVAGSEEKKEVLKLLNYFINDSYGGFGDGWLIYRDEFHNKYSDGLTKEVLNMDLLDWIGYFEKYKH